MSRGLFIGGLAVGGGLALAALAFREREPLGRAAVAVHTKARAAVRKGVRKVTETVQKLTGQIDPSYVQRIAQYNIAALVDQYRGNVPWAVAMAMCEHESEFDVTVYNYTFKNPSTGKVSYPKTNAKPSDALVEVWEKPGDAGCQHDPHACGLFQILDGIRINLAKDKDGVRRPHKPYGYGGFPLPYLNDLFDPEKNIQAALKARSSEAAAMASYAGGDSVFLAELIYFCHAEGKGKLTGGQYPGAFTKLKEAGKAINWKNLVALPWGATGWWSIGNQLSGIAAVAGRTAIWAKNQAKFLPTASDSVQAGADDTADDTMTPAVTQSTIDVLIAAAQEAEMERDLDTAAALRAQIDALQPPTDEGVA